MPKAALAILLLAAPAHAQAPPVPELVRLLREQASPDQAVQDMRQIWETDRWFTFPKFLSTTQNVAAMLRRAGLEDVEIVHPPADGVTQYGFWTMPMAWDAKQATLEIIEPHVPEDLRILADYQKVPTSLGMWSGPTPPGGLNAEVVAATGSLDNLDVKGKLVLTSRNPAGLKFDLARRGALGAINAFTENPDLRDHRQWINAWGDNGWAFTRTSTPLVCFSITPRQSEHLRKLLAAGKVRVRARVDSRYYTGTYPYVTGILRGTGGPEEVLTLGHLFEQGAHDNATGVAAMLGAAETLSRLVRAGRLARPRRSIRVLAMGECYGSMHYLASNPQRVRNTVAAMCVDTPAAPQNLAGVEYTWHLNPHPAKSFTDALVLRLAAEYFPSVRRPWHWREYTSGTDNFLGDPLIGIPTVWPYSGTGVHSHHNSADTPDTVDPRSLRDLMVMNAAYLYYIAAAGPAESRIMAELALHRGLERIAASVAPVIEQITAVQAAVQDGPPLGHLLRQGRERISYSLDRETQAVRSAGASGVEPLLGDLAVAAGLHRRRLERAVGERVAEAPPSPADPEAARIVVRRKRIGTITLDDLAPDLRQGYPAASFSGPPVTALYWCDGRRTLAEVIRLTGLELESSALNLSPAPGRAGPARPAQSPAGPLQFDFVGYFRFLEQRGYVEFAK